MPMNIPKTVEETEEKDKTEASRVAYQPSSGEEDTGTITDRIMDLMEQRQKSADMDKFALAQAGFALMQPAGQVWRSVG